MKILKDSLVYISGEIISKMTVFALLPYVSRKMGAAAYGEFSYFMAYSAVFSLILLLSQDGAVTRYFYFYGKRGLNLILHTGYSYTIMMGLIMISIGLFLQAELMTYLVISVVFANFIAVQLSVRQCQKQATSYFCIQLYSTIISTSATVLALELYETNLVEKRILATLFANIFIFFTIYLLFNRKNNIKHRFSFKKYKIAFLYILSFGIPLMLHNISGVLKGQLDRFFIYHRFSEVELGIYAMGATIASAYTLLLMAVNKATIPYYFEYLKNKKINLRKIQKFVIFSFFIVPLPSLIAYILPENIFIWLLGEQFQGVKYYIVCFLFSNGLFIPYALLVNYLFYYNKNKYISLCSILSTIIYVGVLSLLIQSKIEFIPLASIISSLTIVVILWFITFRLSQNLEN